MTRETQWFLFLDESGNFIRDQTVCVGGLLLQNDHSKQLEGALRERLRRIFPAVRYPPHATELRSPAAHLAHWMAAPRAQQQGHPRADRLAALARVLVESPHRPDEFLSLIDDWRVGRFSNSSRLHSIYKDAERSIRAIDPAGLEVLRALPLEATSEMRRLFEDLAAMSEPNQCMAVAAVDVRNTEDAGEDEKGDRYLRLLEVLFERVYSLLRDHGGERHRVWIYVESLRIEDPVLGRIELRPTDLAAAVRRAEHFPFLAPSSLPDLKVRLVPTLPQGKDPSTHPGLVLADHLMNRLFSAGIRDGVDYESLAGNLETRVGLRPEGFSRSLSMVLPAIAVEGAAREALLRCLAGGPAVSMGESTPPWAKQQAEAWISAVGGKR